MTAPKLFGREMALHPDGSLWELEIAPFGFFVGESGFAQLELDHRLAYHSQHGTPEAAAKSLELLVSEMSDVLASLRGDG